MSPGLRSQHRSCSALNLSQVSHYLFPLPSAFARGTSQSPWKFIDLSWTKARSLISSPETLFMPYAEVLGQHCGYDCGLKHGTCSRVQISFATAK